MSSSYFDIYKYKDGFTKNKPSDTSVIDRRLKKMLEEFRKKRREELINQYRTNMDSPIQKSTTKSNMNSKKSRYSKFYRDWSLAFMWSRELIEYNWLNSISDLNAIIESCDEWLILPLEKGIRCMFIHGNGYCELRSDEGWRIAVIENPPFKHSGLTIIDGVYDNNINVFYCNDIIVWNNLNMCNATTECRLHLLKSSIEDTYSTRKSTEDVNMTVHGSCHTKRSILSINLKLGDYYPLSKSNITKLYGNAIMKDSLVNYTHFILVNKNSIYLSDKDDESHLEFKDCSQIRYIWRDSKMRQLGNNMNENTLSFKLELYNDLLYANKVLIGKVNSTEKEICKLLALEEDQKTKLKEDGYLIVKVKFEMSNILDIIGNFTSNNCQYISTSETLNTNLFDISNISARNKMICKSDNIDYIIFRCVEFLHENRESTKMHATNALLSNLDICTLINSFP